MEEYLTKEEIAALGKKHARYFAAMVTRELFVRMDVPPVFEIGEDNTAWTGPSGGVQKIHVGLGLLFTYDDGCGVCRNESEFLAGMRFLTEHEMGHQKYTTDRAFSGAIRNGTEGFVRYASKMCLGKEGRITKESDMAEILKEISGKCGLFISLREIQEIMHFVANSMDDGRMERKVAAEKRGFKTDLKWYRGGYWLHSGVTDDAKDISKEDVFLTAVLNQILFYATMGIWQKDFFRYYGGTEVETRIRALQPLIKEGVQAKSCKKGMAAALKVMEELYPDILAACKKNTFPQSVQSMCESSQKAMPDMDPNGRHKRTYNTSEAEDAAAENGDGVPVPVNIFKDDSSEEKAGGDMQSSAGPGSSSGSDNAKGFSADESKDGSGPDNKSGSSAGVKGKEGKDTSFAALKEDADKANESMEGAADASLDPTGSSLNKEDTASNDTDSTNRGRSGSKGQDFSEGKGIDEEAVLKIEEAMREAAKEGNSLAEAALLEASIYAEARESIQEKEDTSTVSETLGKELYEICPDFKEFKRAYEVDEDLPYEIEQECSILKKKYEKYFKSRSAYVRRNQKSGRIDPRSLHRLVRGDTDVYIRKGDDKSFSGCIEILLDNSGSMTGFKKKQACMTLARIEEILKEFVPMKIEAFDYNSQVNAETIKNWGEVKKKNCSWNYMLKSRRGGMTPTAEILAVSLAEMKRRPEKHKMIVLLTDEAYGYEGENLANVISEVKRAGVLLTAIYFENGEISDGQKRSFLKLFGEESGIVCKPEEIGEELLPVVDRFTKL